jgi:hypothetical protein
MLEDVKAAVRRMTSRLHLISGYLEMENYTKALGKRGNHEGDARAGYESNGTDECRHECAGRWGGRRSARLDWGYEDVNVDVDKDKTEVRSVDKNEVFAGHGNDNPQTN